MSRGGGGLVNGGSPSANSRGCRWRSVYIIGAVISLFLNVFVLVAQAFLKLPALNALAPTQAEPPFAIAQGLVLILFVVLGIGAAMKFRPAAALSA